MVNSFHLFYLQDSLFFQLVEPSKCKMHQKISNIGGIKYLEQWGSLEKWENPCDSSGTTKEKGLLQKGMITFNLAMAPGVSIRQIMIPRGQINSHYTTQSDICYCFLLTFCIEENIISIQPLYSPRKINKFL